MQWTIENMWAFHIWPDGTPFSNTVPSTIAMGQAHLLQPTNQFTRFFLYHFTVYMLVSL